MTSACSRSYGASLVAITLVLVVAQPAPAAPAAAAAAASGGDSYFLSSGAPHSHLAHVPLAVVHGGEVADAVPRPPHWPAQRPRSCGPRARWAAVGSRWLALDGWGQVIGETSVGRRSIYDVTRCAELEMSTVRDAGGRRHRPGQTVYVSADSAWRASPAPVFTPPAPDAEAFTRLVAENINDRSVRGAPLHPECAAIPKRTRFFSGTDGARYAVGTSNVGYLVAKLDGGRWSIVVTELTTPHKRDYYTCYRPVAVFDMNGDGTPEVVLRQSAGEAWGDLVLGRMRDGVWRVVALSPGSAVV